MSLFTKDLATLKSALEGIGFNVSAIGPDTPDQLAAYIEQQVEEATAEHAAALAEAISDRDSLKELLEASTAANATHGARIDALGAALQAVGVSAAAHETAEDLTAALTDRVSIRAAEQLAAQGQDTLLSDAPNVDPSKAQANKPKLTGAARAIAHWQGQ